MNFKSRLRTIAAVVALMACYSGALPCGKVSQQHLLSFLCQRGPQQVQNLLDTVRVISSEHTLDHELVLAVIATESRCRAGARSARGAKGMMQLMPSTAKSLGVVDPFDSEQNIRGGTKYLSQLLHRFNDLELALAAYNSGPGTVRKYGRIPPYPETRAYVKRVMKYYRLLQARPVVAEV